MFAPWAVPSLEKEPAVANPSKDKGTKWETEVTKWFITSGFPDAMRITLKGKNDPGDIYPIPGNTPPIIVSAKYGYSSDVHPQTQLWMKWWRELLDTRDRVNPDALVFLCHHREMKASPEFAHWYTLSLDWGPVKVTGEQVISKLYTMGFIE